MSFTQAYPAPESVFRFFYEMSQIPRPSGQEAAIAGYLTAFAESRGLENYHDAANNVIIIKEASAGREQEEPVILQGHMDMVCEKEAGCAKDMEKEGLDLVLDGDWLSAEGTTLGGDDGIAVAIALALLDDETLSHPRLECVFTTAEETGMDGALALDPAPLKGHLLLNIDSEEEGVLTAGCAGGVEIKLHAPLPREAGKTENASVIRLSLSGLTGGHSGSMIRCGRANADVVMIRVLRELSSRQEIRLISLSGGNKHNAIPRDAEAVILADDPEAALQQAALLGDVLKAEYNVTDPKLQLTAETAVCGEEEPVPAAVSASDTKKLLALLSSVPDGVQRMNQQLSDQLETSLNLGILRSAEDGFYAEYLLRSSSDSRLEELKERILYLASCAGFSAECFGAYPAWEFVPESAFRDKMVRIFREQYKKEPVVEAIHAGLECGLLSKKIPGLDAVSIGPDIPDIHTPQERLSVSSVERTYAYIRRILEEK